MSGRIGSMAVTIGHALKAYERACGRYPSRVLLWPADFWNEVPVAPTPGVGFAAFAKPGHVRVEPSQEVSPGRMRLCA